MSEEEQLALALQMSMSAGLMGEEDTQPMETGASDSAEQVKVDCNYMCFCVRSFAYTPWHNPFLLDTIIKSKLQEHTHGC